MRSWLLFVIFGVVFTTMNLFILNYLVQTPSKNTECDCNRERNLHTVSVTLSSRFTTSLRTSTSSTSTSTSTSQAVVATTIISDNRTNAHKLAVVVPFRDRHEEMMEFIPHMHKFLKRQNIVHQIWVINQVDTHRSGHSKLKLAFQATYNIMHILYSHGL